MSTAQLRDSLKRFRKRKTAIFGTTIIVGFIIVTILSPYIIPYDPFETNFAENLDPPSMDHPFGTDELGRDVLSRVIIGSRVSLYVGFTASLMSLFIGVLFGIFAGYFGGVLSFLLQQITDIFLSVPQYFLYILVIAVFRIQNIYIMALVIGIFMWPRLARIVRSETISLKEQVFTMAARSLGAGKLRIMFRHILPNTMASIIVVFTLNIAIAILMESALAFLGFGDPTLPSWGLQLGRGRRYLPSAWWLTTFPGIAVFLTVLSFNLVGDGLRDSLDPRLRGKHLTA